MVVRFSVFNDHYLHIKMSVETGCASKYFSLKPYRLNFTVTIYTYRNNDPDNKIMLFRFTEDSAHNFSVKISHTLKTVSVKMMKNFFVEISKNRNLLLFGKVHFTFKSSTGVSQTTERDLPLYWFNRDKHLKQVKKVDNERASFMPSELKPIQKPQTDYFLITAVICSVLSVILTMGALAAFFSEKKATIKQTKPIMT